MHPAGRTAERHGNSGLWTEGVDEQTGGLNQSRQLRSPFVLENPQEAPEQIGGAEGPP